MYRPVLYSNIFFWQNRLMLNQKPNPTATKSLKKLPKSELLGLFQHTFFASRKGPRSCDWLL